MTIALTLEDYLTDNNVPYDVMSHRYTNNSIDSARAAHIPKNQMAKSVVLKDDDGYVMAVIPANHHVQLGVLSNSMNRRLGLATEAEVASLFADCDLGAIPPTGEAYNMEVVIDDDLADCRDIYFEGGDHRDIVHMNGEDFQWIMREAQHCHFSQQFLT